MGRPKSRQEPRTTMSIRVSERERRQIEEKAVATGTTPSAYIRTMALESGDVDTIIHEDRQKLMHDYYLHLGISSGAKSGMNGLLVLIFFTIDFFAEKYGILGLISRTKERISRWKY